MNRHHNHGHAYVVSRHKEVGRLKWVLTITLVFMVAEIVGGFFSRSLALLADAGHMFTDVAALSLSLFAMRLAQRPPSKTKTFGYVRLEILGIAILGLGVNVVGAALLRSHAHDNLNVRGAYLHVLGDLLGSVGTIVAGVIILTTGWTPADPIISVVMALLILYGAWKLVREAAEVLLEAVPTHVDMDVVLNALRSIEGLDEVHDVHVWTLTSGFVALSAHGVIDDPARHTSILDEIRARMAEYDIAHITFQIEMRAVYQIPSSGSEP